MHGELQSIGAIVDDRFGADVLDRLTGTGIWIARPVEVPGSRPLAFEAEAGPAIALRAWPAEHVAKCLVFYDTADPEPLRNAQEAALLQLQLAAHSTGHEWLLELIPPAGRAPEAVVPLAMERLYEIGLVPDWWKLPPSADKPTWRRIGDIIRANDPYARGVLLLGLDASDSELATAFAAAADEPMVRGFAVGRTIFWPIAEKWFTGAITDTDASRLLAKACHRVVAHWRNVRPLGTDECRSAPLSSRNR